MKHDLEKLKLHSESVKDYVSAEGIAKDHFQRKESEYKLDSSIVRSPFLV